MRVRVADNLHFVGESHCLAFSNLIAEDEGTGETFLTRAAYLPGLAAANCCGADGALHAELVDALTAEALLGAEGTACHRAPTRTMLSAFYLAGRAFIAPPVVLFAGDVDLYHGLFRKMGDGYDFECAEAPHLPVRHDAKPVPRASIERHLEAAYAPLQAALRRLKECGLDRLILHALPPRSADEERSARWTKGPCPWSVRTKATLVANAVLRRIAAAEGALFLDLWDDLSEGDALRPEFDADGIHFNRRGALVSLDRTIRLLLDTGQGGFNAERWQQLWDVAPPPPSAPAPRRLRVADPALFRADWTPLPANRLARLTWSGAPLTPAAGGPTLHAPSPADLAALHRLLLEHAETAARLAAALGRAVTVHSAEALTFAPGRHDALVPPAPPGTLVGLLMLDAGGEITVAEATFAAEPGELVLLTPGDAAALAATAPLRAYRLCLAPRHPLDPPRVLWAGGNHWPKDPFQYSVRGFHAVPPVGRDDVSHRSPVY